MATEDLLGPYRLEFEEVNRVVTRKSPGAYAIGESAPTFSVRGIGRSDDDVADAIRWRAGEQPEFKYAYTASAKEAFRLECRLFHEHSTELRSISHPTRPAGSGWECVACRVFGDAA